MDKEDVVRVEFYSDIEKNEILPFAATEWMKRILSFVNQVKERQILYDVTYAESKKKHKRMYIAKQTHRHRKQTSA